MIDRSLTKTAIENLFRAALAWAGLVGTSKNCPPGNF